ncbi:hypothetical protein BC940DRAFT_312623 [Gongronella butleri]|nr:hypothetical protein BC940DRAFT_312623 [Gongronella butleri]
MKLFVFSVIATLCTTHVVFASESLGVSDALGSVSDVVNAAVNLVDNEKRDVSGVPKPIAAKRMNRVAAALARRDMGSLLDLLTGDSVLSKLIDDDDTLSVDELTGEVTEQVQKLVQDGVLGNDDGGLLKLIHNILKALDELLDSISGGAVDLSSLLDGLHLVRRSGLLSSLAGHTETSTGGGSSSANMQANPITQSYSNPMPMTGPIGMTGSAPMIPQEPPAFMGGFPQESDEQHSDEQDRQREIQRYGGFGMPGVEQAGAQRQPMTMSQLAKRAADTEQLVRGLIGNLRALSSKVDASNSQETHAGGMELIEKLLHTTLQLLKRILSSGTGKARRSLT